MLCILHGWHAGTLPNPLLDIMYANPPDRARGVLKLSNNAFYGFLPALGSSTVVMESITLASNYLTGTLPPTWAANFDKLAVLSLESNSLQGSIPIEWDTAWSNLPAAQPVGVPPMDTQRSDMWKLMLGSNPCLCGAVPTYINRYAQILAFKHRALNTPF